MHHAAAPVSEHLTSTCRGASRKRSTNRAPEPNADWARRWAEAKAAARPASSLTRIMPMPPPPAAALIITG